MLSKVGVTQLHLAGSGAEQANLHYGDILVTSLIVYESLRMIVTPGLEEEAIFFLREGVGHFDPTLTTLAFGVLLLSIINN